MAKQNDDEQTVPMVAMPQALVELLLEKLGAPPAATFNPEMLAQILQQTGLNTAAAMQKALKPENAHHPGVSCYSYPEGDYARPRPKLKCRMTWVSAEIDPETMHWYELELLNTAVPGNFKVTNADQGETTLSITPVMDKTTGAMERLDFAFPVRDGQSKNVSPMSVWLLESQGKSYMDAMVTWLGVMAQDLKAKAEGVPALA